MQIPRHESFRQGQSHLILLELRPGRHLRGRRVWSKMLLVLVNWSWISKQYRNLKIYIKSSWTIWHSKKVEHTHAFAFSFVVGVHVPAISKRRSPRHTWHIKHGKLPKVLAFTFKSCLRGNLCGLPLWCTSWLCPALTFSLRLGLCFRRSSHWARRCCSGFGCSLQIPRLAGWCRLWCMISISSRLTCR